MPITPQQVATLQMIAAMAISGTVGLFVLESGQSPYNVVFFRCLFGVACEHPAPEYRCHPPSGCSAALGRPGAG